MEDLMKDAEAIVEEGKEEKTKDEITEEEMRLIRQINYTIIRRLWDAVHGGIGAKRVVGGQDPNSLISFLEMSKDKLDRITSGYTGEVHLKTIAEKLNKKTGLEESIFYGSKMLYINTLYDKKKWADYFKVKKKYSTEKNDGIKKKQLSKPAELTDFEKELYKTLKTVNPNILENRDLFLLKYYIRVGAAYLEANQRNRPLELINELNDITINQLEQLEPDQLKSYYKSIKKQYSLISAVITYQENKKI